MGGARCMFGTQGNMATALSFGEDELQLALLSLLFFLWLSKRFQFENFPRFCKCLHKNLCVDKSAGSVPSFYREVYQIVCPNQEERIERDMFVKILMKSSLPKQSLSQVKYKTYLACLFRSLWMQINDRRDVRLSF